MQESQEPRLTKDLFLRAQGGDEDAFADLVRATRPRLEVLVHIRMGRRLRRVVDPEDVLQETYFRAYRALPSFDYHSRTAAFRWLATMAERVIVQFARYYLTAQKRAGPRSEEGRSPPWVRPRGSDFWGLLPSVASCPAATLMREERFDRLERALEQLSPEHREVILLARVHELTIQEIASRMGRTPEAVSMLLLRAVRKLREIFGDTDSWRLPAHRIAALAAASEPSYREPGEGGRPPAEGQASTENSPPLEEDKG